MSAVLTPECGLHAARRLHRLVWTAPTPERADSTTDRRAPEPAGAGLPPDGDGAPMGAEPEVATFVVRLVAERAGRVAGVVERVRGGEKGRTRDIKVTGPLVAATRQGDAKGREAPMLGGDGIGSRGCTFRRA